MLGQLDWDGVVLPITEMTWENVLSTAGRLQGLDINEEFFVTYKDDEGDVINVKNETDLGEAIRWAEEQGVPCLCLHVPYSSSESDSDESWTEIDNGSPRGEKTNQRNEDSQELEEAEKRPLDDESTPPVDEDRDDAEPKQAEEQAEDEEQAVDDEEKQTPHQQDDVVAPVELHVIEEAFQKEQAEPLLDKECEVEVDTKEAPVMPEVQECRKTSNEIVTVTPVQGFDLLAREELSKVHPIIGIDRLIEIMCSVNDNTQQMQQDDRTFFLSMLSSVENVEKAVAFFCHPAVRQAIANIAQQEKSSAGITQKAATTQLIKILYQNPEVLGLMNDIPYIEDVMLRVLRGLKSAAEPKETEPEAVEKVCHTNVTCDGCGSSDELLEASIIAGCRNDQGEIVGARYKSAVLPDYDLCETCEADGRFQQDAGPFLKIVDPAQAPDVILCAMPGTTGGMAQLESLDWRNPVAREFFEFVKARQQRAFNPQRQPSAPPTVAAASAPVPTVSKEESAPVSNSELPCKHMLKAFNAPHGSFFCDICKQAQPSNALLHGCRPCNFDVCHQCYTDRGMGLSIASPPKAEPAPTQIAAPAPPQAKFVSDVTLTDGCPVRPGERLNKTWRVRNSGPERWPQGTRICHVGGDAFGGPANGVEVPLAAPGEAVNVTVPLVMPSLPGRYTSYWRMVTAHPQNSKFGHRFWVTVNVLPPAPPSAVPVVRATPVMPAPSAPAFRAPPPPPPPAMPVLPMPPTTLPGSPPALVRPPVVQVQQQAPANQSMDLAADMADKVARITDFGFTDIDRIVRILQQVNGDVAATVERLLEEA